MQVLTLEEVDMVSGGDRGDATVAGAIAGGTAGFNAIARGSALGVRLGALAGPLGIAGGLIIGGAGGYLLYRISV